MNIYFLLEGENTEKKIYRDWLKYLLPNFSKVDYYDQVEQYNYYLISGCGYPQTVTKGLLNASEKIQETGKYDYLVLVVDADEDTIVEREQYIYDSLQKQEIDLGKTQLVIIIQNRCIETWLLGNRAIFNHIINNITSPKPPLSDYLKYYDVVKNDPELMGFDQTIASNHATFHYKYLKAILGEKYTKKRPRIAQEESYFRELMLRVNDQSDHLKSFQSLIEFCQMINQNTPSN